MEQAEPEKSNVSIIIIIIIIESDENTEHTVLESE
jgi:hypothetical protein